MACDDDNIFDKNIDATLDYGIDWTDWLNGDTIATSSWDVPAGITNENEGFDDNETVIWLSGGSVGPAYKLVNTVTTNSTPPREEERCIFIYIIDPC